MVNSLLVLTLAKWGWRGSEAWLTLRAKWAEPQKDFSSGGGTEEDTTEEHGAESGAERGRSNAAENPPKTTKFARKFDVSSRRSWGIDTALEMGKNLRAIQQKSCKIRSVVCGNMVERTTVRRSVVKMAMVCCQQGIKITIFGG